MSEFAVRVISGIIGVLLLAGILFFDGILINLFVFALIFIAFLEIKNAFTKIDIIFSLIYGCILSVFVSLELYFYNQLFFTMYLLLLMTLFDLLVLRNNIKNSSALAFSSLYIILGFSSLVLLGNHILIGLVFVLAFSSDSFAYLVGITFGKHKLIPDVSPKKSVEGALGGIIGTVILTILYLSYFELSSIGYDIILGILASILAQCGDLIASRIKRDTGIKDFGKLIPGHGGILDRFDSVLLVGPIVMLVTKFLYHI